MVNNNKNPLTPAVLHILLALSTGEKHGYAIMKQVKIDSLGKINMGPGTLYGSISRMLEAGLIAESNKKTDSELQDHPIISPEIINQKTENTKIKDSKLNDQRRVYYKMTSEGENALTKELQRYREIVSLAEKQNLIPDKIIYET